MDRAEFESIYRKYVNLVHSVAHNVIHDYHIAQDVCQEVFLKLHQRMEHIRAEGLKAWLEVVAENTAKDYWRKLQQQTKREETSDQAYQSGALYGTAVIGAVDGSSAEPEFADQGLDQRLELREFGYRAFKALQEKNPEWYRIILFLDVSGFSVKETAQQLKLSAGTLRVKHCRARNWLRRKFSSKLQEIL